ncbi:PREDICTED: cell wall protein DAN4-like [Branchiostoma belcheri]|uniref:Cell wall protein DAN4-like n=1 Tax=Branchiostoma belcheri TaxID=7741 RepID=A0A6P5AHL7_BRABE|nr:PREDICTED: cell wall protein DAN4-like [Branchiostoma belcheri]
MSIQSQRANTTTPLAVTTTPMTETTTNPRMVPTKTTTLSVVTTTPSVVTTTPSVVTTTPSVVTTTPSVVTTTPSVVTTTPSVVTTTPSVVTTTPTVVTTTPSVVTTTPSVVTTTPSVVTTTPSVVTTTPSVVTTKPSVVTTTPSVVTTTPSVVTTTPSVVTTTPSVVTTTPVCRNGYQLRSGICYKAFKTQMNFLDARWTCRTEGGTLAMPKDASTNEFLVSLKNDEDEYGKFWLGLERSEEVSVDWKWADGTRLGHYSAWGPGEPNNDKNDEDCAHYIYKGTAWNDAPCSMDDIKPICQVNPEAAKRDDCRFGYKLVSGACFRLDFREMSYDAASEACKGQGARLAMPKTRELDTALRNLVRTEGLETR